MQTPTAKSTPRFDVFLAKSLLTTLLGLNFNW